MSKSLPFSGTPRAQPVPQNRNDQASHYFITLSTNHQASSTVTVDSLVQINSENPPQVGQGARPLGRRPPLLKGPGVQAEAWRPPSEPTADLPPGEAGTWEAEWAAFPGPATFISVNSGGAPNLPLGSPSRSESGASRRGRALRGPRPPRGAVAALGRLQSRLHRGAAPRGPGSPEGQAWTVPGALQGRRPADCRGAARPL